MRRGLLVVWALAGATVVTEMAYPLTTGTVRDRLTIGTVAVFCCCSVLHAALTRGARVAGVLVVVSAGGGLLVEAVGTATGLSLWAVTAESRTESGSRRDRGGLPSSRPRQSVPRQRHLHHGVARLHPPLTRHGNNG